MNLRTMVAPLPINEAERLRQVTATCLLDSPPEASFDELTRLAAAICETPIALITLLDGHRQWFKSRVGLEVQQTSRDISFCGHAILQQKLFLVPDALLDERFADNPLVTDDPHIRFYAGMPLDSGDGVNLGTLCVIDRVPRELATGQKDALQILSRQVLAQIQLRQQVEALKQLMTEQHRVERALRESEALFRAFMDHSPIIGFMKDADGRMVYYNRTCAERFGVNQQEWLGRTDFERLPPDFAAYVRAHDLYMLRTGCQLVVEECPPMPDGSTVHWNAHRFPFVNASGERYIAAIAVDVTKEREAQEQLKRYQAELEQANLRLLDLSLTDGLTGLKNRRAFDERLRTEFELACRHHSPLSVLMLDVDDFKLFNDAFGHAEGDYVLRRVAESLEQTARRTDLVARYGGEEFTVLLPSTGAESALHFAERIRAAIISADWERVCVTVSIGIATLDTSMLNPESLLHAADLALYQAKRLGKNCVCV